MDLIIVRGLPGSGKSTWAHNFIAHRICPGRWRHYEADQFFEDDVSGYTFDHKLLGAAHDWCYGSTAKALKNGWDVVISNTFTTLWEMERYVALATLISDVRVRVVEVKTQFKSVHGVPEDKIKKMAARWQDIPQDWIINGLSVEVIK